MSDFFLYIKLFMISTDRIIRNFYPVSDTSETE